MSTGYAVLMDIDGNKIDFSTMPRGYKTQKLRNCKRITARSTVMTQVKVVYRHSSHGLKTMGFLANFYKNN